jgi:acyl-CoA synthetase (AMP-forming)/AMP-acid ligase II
MTRHLQLADVLEVVADAIPDRPAVITSDGTHRTYRELDDRATRLANHLAANGVGPGDHVGIHATNCIEWCEAFYACFKIRAVPINVNYRYVEAELRYLYDNAECVAVIAQPEFVAAIDAVRDVLPKLKHLLVTGEQYETALAEASPERAFAERSGDDIYIIYTGGTTGMPKGVMWRNEDLILGALNQNRFGLPIDSIEQLGTEAATQPNQFRLTAVGPMMHGAGQWTMGNAHVCGGVFLLYTDRRFDAHRLLAFLSEAKAVSVGLLGDAMARPVAEALLDPKRPDYDLSSLMAITNAAAQLTPAVRAQLMEAAPNVLLLDAYGSSETGVAGSRMGASGEQEAPRFEVQPNTTVMREDGTRCDVGEVGILTRTGHIPVGYWNDPEKTAATFKIYDGVRWSISGDFARLEGDGTLSMLGRGSVTINSGGEKIHPEEVEGALMGHPAVLDAIVIGTPNERWGQQVTAIVKRRDGRDVSEDELRAHARTVIADYKVPKAVLFVDTMPRTPVGKVDYKGAAELAILLLAGS